MTANTTNLTLTAVKDTAGAWNGTQYKVPVSGDYVVAGATNATGNIYTTQVFVNGSLANSGFFSTTPSTAGSAYVSAGSVFLPGLAAGALISITSSITTTVSSGAIGIYRLSGPSVIAATESVNARYSGAPTGTVGSSFATATALTLPTKTFDSHNAWSGGTSYTVPVSGKMSMVGQIVVTATATSNGYAIVALTVNGNEIVDYVTQLTGSPTTIVVPVNDSYVFNAGDVITFRAYSNMTSPIFGTNAAQNHMALTRIGN